VDEGLMGSVELGELKAALRQHLEMDETVVYSGLEVQAWGRKTL
jgi:hypothetical protein